MYKCEEHGQLESEWCDECQKIVECDCTNQMYTRFKDLELNSKKARTVTLLVCHCATCGEPTHTKHNVPLSAV